MLQSLVLSGGILPVLVPLSAFGVLGLAAVILTHELAEVLVIANGVRAGRRPSAGAGSSATTRPTPERAQEPVRSHGVRPSHSEHSTTRESSLDGTAPITRKEGPGRPAEG